MPGKAPSGTARRLRDALAARTQRQKESGSAAIGAYDIWVDCVLVALSSVCKPPAVTYSGFGFSLSSSSRIISYLENETHIRLSCIAQSSSMKR